MKAIIAAAVFNRLNYQPIFIFIITLLSCNVIHASTLYGVDGGSRLYTINQTTAEMSLVGQFLVDSQPSGVNTLAFTPVPVPGSVSLICSELICLLEIARRKASV